MDPTLSTMKAVDIASHITGPKGWISVKDLMLQLS